MQIFLFSIKDGSQGHVVVTFCDKWDKVFSPNEALKVERGPKEDERVERGHFHDRLVYFPRYRSLKIASRSIQISNSKILPLLKA